MAAGQGLLTRWDGNGDASYASRRGYIRRWCCCLPGLDMCR